MLILLSHSLLSGQLKMHTKGATRALTGHPEETDTAQYTNSLFFALVIQQQSKGITHIRNNLYPFIYFNETA